MEIKYEWKRDSTGCVPYLLTKCPNRVGFTGRVGSSSCAKCRWFKSVDHDNQIVECLFEEKNK